MRYVCNGTRLFNKRWLLKGLYCHVCKFCDRFINANLYVLNNDHIDFVWKETVFSVVITCIINTLIIKINILLSYSITYRLAVYQLLTLNIALEKIPLAMSACVKHFTGKDLRPVQGRPLLECPMNWA